MKLEVTIEGGHELQLERSAEVSAAIDQSWAPRTSAEGIAVGVLGVPSKVERS